MEAPGKYKIISRGDIMSIPIINNGIKYFVVDSKTLEMYKTFYVGYIFIEGRRYKKYVSSDKNILVEA